VHVIFAPTPEPPPPDVDLGQAGPRKRHASTDPEA
jgi:hypothetical protein